MFRYEGDTGLIVRVDEHVVVVLSDLSMDEVCPYLSFVQDVKARREGELVNVKVHHEIILLCSNQLSSF